MICMDSETASGFVMILLGRVIVLHVCSLHIAHHIMRLCAIAAYRCIPRYERIDLVNHVDWRWRR